MKQPSARSVIRSLRAVGILPCLLAGSAFTPGAVEAGDADTSLLRLDLEDLMTMRVTSVSKREESLFDAASAIAVLTGDEILAAGAWNIPDALRLVPGMNVARSDSVTWAVSSRGFNDQYSNKLLVLVDGRSVYNPLYSGVFWDMQNLILEDLDRIEVIRGPGSTLWGANAVNGVVNISTKPAKDTQGFLLRVGGGDELMASTALRYGGKAGEDLHYRVGAQFTRESLPAFPMNSDPVWDRIAGGVRLDWEPGEATTVTFQSDYSSSQPEIPGRVWTPVAPYLQIVPDDSARRSLNVLGRLTHRFSEESELIWQSYADGINGPSAELDFRTRTYDTELRHRFPLGERQEITWGGGLRRMTGTLAGSFNGRFASGQKQVLDVGNVFAQDQIALVEDKLLFTAGAKVEHNNLSGADLLPNGRLSWKITDRQTLWTAVSRSARTPTLTEYDVLATAAIMPQPASPMNPLGLPVVAELRGSHDIESESIDAFELGYRIELTEGLTLDLAAFHNRYDELLTLEPGAPEVVGAPMPQYIVQPLNAANRASGQSTGGEAQLDWRAADYWRVRTHASFNRISIEPDPGSGDTVAAAAEMRSPTFQFLVENTFTLPRHVTLSLVVRHVSQLFDGAIPAYVACDARVAWEFRPGCELAVAGRNLFDPAHPEFGSAALRNTAQTEVQRSVFASLTLRF